MNTKEIGKLGEDIAADYLRKKGYKILERNFEIKISRFFKSEIDIVTKPRRSVFDTLRGKKGDAIHFVEVKTLVDGKDFSPEAKVNFQKKQKLTRTAQIWLSKNKISLDTPWQIDIIAIKLNSQEQFLNNLNPEISHFENAVSG